MPFSARQGFVGGADVVIDDDAQAWADAVAVADGQSLETGAIEAVSKFVTGTKADGIWDNLDVIYMMSIARTLAGVAVPLKGNVSPTYNNWVTGDYDRVSGLKGNRISQTTIDTNYAMNTFNTGNLFVGAYQTEKREDRSVTGEANEALFGIRETATSNSSFYLLSNEDPQGCDITRYFNLQAVIHNLGGSGTLVPYDIIGLHSTSSNSSAQYTTAAGSFNDTITQTVNAASADNLFVFTRRFSGEIFTGRLAYFCVGSHVSHDALDARMDTLYSDIQGIL